MIAQYIKSPSRNKVVFHKAPIDEINSLDVGLLLSEKIETFSSDKKISIKVHFEIETIFNESIVANKEFGKVLALRNIGILFENDLKIDFNSLLDKYSRNNTLFIHWEGQIEKNILYFLRKGTGKKINIKNLSHIAL